MSTRSRLVLLLVVAALVVSLDQWTKVLALENLSPIYTRTVIEGFFSLTLVMNSGVAFGVFNSIDSSVKALVLLGFSGVTVGLVVAYYLLDKALTRTAAVALAMIVGGACGNMIDRWRFAKVVDFLDFYWHGYHWPAFNVADIAITVGVMLLLLTTLFGSQRS